MDCDRVMCRSPPPRQMNGQVHVQVEHVHTWVVAWLRDEEVRRSTKRRWQRGSGMRSAAVGVLGNLIDFKRTAYQAAGAGGGVGGKPGGDGEAVGGAVRDMRSSARAGGAVLDTK